ncbi:MepB family protein [Paenibacillus peoriae]|uniref:MepB family protein n=1 Tax=Paenibacillus peoriae TaxID=59893 RepID=UPI00215B61E1|nr:MepB family protein [Paenibacillus peoriae]
MVNKEISSGDQNSWTASDKIHTDLLAAKVSVYNPCNFKCTGPIPEKQNADYGAYFFNLNAHSIRFRIAKTTPKKIGQFVTIYKRIGDGPIQPYDVSDPIDFLVISARKDSSLGQFVFPKSILIKHKILSNKGEGGKRAIRIYPPWDTPTSLQAQKTQTWQLKYFLNIPVNKPIDISRANVLYELD